MEFEVVSEEVMSVAWRRGPIGGNKKYHKLTIPSIVYLHQRPSMAAYTIKSQNRVGEGIYYRINHQSVATKTHMTFGLFLPNRFASSNVVDGGDGDDATKKDNVPVMYWLSGLTCDGMYYYYFIGICVCSYHHLLTKK